MMCNGVSTWHSRIASAAPLRRVEKMRDCNGLHTNSEENKAHPETLSGASTIAAPSHSGTEASVTTVPQSLCSGFAAQVLGQILETKRQSPLLAAQAYEQVSHKSKQAGAEDTRLLHLA